jgi:hypothetical protein
MVSNALRARECVAACMEMESAHWFPMMSLGKISIDVNSVRRVQPTVLNK